jgi:L-threonylcarbamoyladenylate synthase
MTSTNNYTDIIHKAIEVLKNGGTILYPTDTIWGLGCDATNEKAVEKIFKIKQRTESKSLIILVEDDAKVNKYVKQVPDVAWDIFEYSTKPTTLVLDDAVGLATNVIAEDGSIGIRVCKQPFCYELLRKFNKAIVSTSANVSGAPSPSSFQDIDPSIISNVDYVVNLPQYHRSNNSPSSVIRIRRNSVVEILRK